MLKKLATLLTASLFVICLAGAIRNSPDRGVKIISPKANDVVQAGDVCEIHWYADAEFGDLMTIEFSKNGGKSWDTVAKDVPNNGKYLWKVPEIDSAHCKVRVFFQDKPKFRGTSEMFSVIGGRQ